MLPSCKSAQTLDNLANISPGGEKNEIVSHSVVSNSLWPCGLYPARLLSPWDSPGKNTEVGYHSLLQGIFLTQGWNLGLLHCRPILYHLSYQGSPLYVGNSISMNLTKKTIDVLKDIWLRIFVATLFRTGKNWKPSKGPTIGDQLCKL